MNESDDTLEIHTRRSVEASTIWLHGQGTSSEDLTPLLKNLSGARELGLRYLAPNAPVRRLNANGGRPGRAWYDTASPDATHPDPASIKASHTRLAELLDRERQQGMPPEKTLVAGFSQGAAMALHAGLRYPYPLAGIIVLSGELLCPEELASRIHPANAGTPVLMIHGTEDNMIPLQEAEANRDRLRALGIPVDWHSLSLGHEINEETIGIIDQWIQVRLKDQGVTRNRDD